LEKVFWGKRRRNLGKGNVKGDSEDHKEERKVIMETRRSRRMEIHPEGDGRVKIRPKIKNQKIKF